MNFPPIPSLVRRTAPHGVGNASRFSVNNCPRQESNLHGIATTRPSTKPDGETNNGLADDLGSDADSVYRSCYRCECGAVTKANGLDPDLAKFVAAWPTLAEPLKRAALALIESLQ